MEEYDYEVLKQVGKASHEALEYSKSVVKPGVSLLDAAEKIEGFIKGKGFDLAFPINISIDSNAAHYTPSVDDKSVFREKDLVKIDLGARKEFYLGDCALTIDLSGENGKLLEASEEALNAAISTIKAGRKVSDIGKEVEKVAEAKGVKPIRNLGGHLIEKHELHSMFIPNFDNGDDMLLEEGQVIAIEPFMTNGEGLVHDGDLVQIYQKAEGANVRTNELRNISESIDAKYLTYPFALRWLLKDFDEFKVRRTLSELLSINALEEFPVLEEKSNGMVAQAEKELIVEKDSCTIVTK